MSAKWVGDAKKQTTIFHSICEVMHKHKARQVDAIGALESCICFMIMDQGYDLENCLKVIDAVADDMKECIMANKTLLMKPHGSA